MRRTRLHARGQQDWGRFPCMAKVPLNDGVNRLVVSSHDTNRAVFKSLLKAREQGSVEVAQTGKTAYLRAHLPRHSPPQIQFR